jgi:hypothetical protein
VAESPSLDDVFYDLTRDASKVLTRGRVLVEEDDAGSHHAVAVEVPIEVIRALAESVQHARALLDAERARRAA